MRCAAAALSALSCVTLGRLLAGNPDKQANLRVVRSLAARHPELPQARLAVAHVALAAGDARAALEETRRAAYMQPGWEAAAIFEAQVLQRESAERAAQSLAAFLERYPEGNFADLARRKLLPALYNLARDGRLPPRFALVGSSRSQLTDDELRTLANTEYFDIMLLHWQHTATWPADTARWQDAIARGTVTYDGNAAKFNLVGPDLTAKDWTDLLAGIGGTPEGIITAAAIRCMGGAIHGQLAPKDDEERQKAIDATLSVIGEAVKMHPTYSEEGRLQKKAPPFKEPSA